MSVRVVARLRPLLKAEVERDQIVSIHNGPDNKPTTVKIPNPKNFSEEYGFQFNSVYGQQSTQQEIFEAEVTPTVKHLFLGYDITIFAYGSTGTGKTHTMRGGKSLADRGLIPRLLSSIYRKSRAVEKSGGSDTKVDVSMSYYEIYNDRVYDLFEAPEKRNATGLPIREAEGGKTVVVGLTEMPCSSLKDFELLYDRANANRSTGATKLNAHSSRSHAILCVKVTITTPTETRVSTASAIDLAGSEDNRRTGNGKDRMVESASINKSLFVLAQCVEAISKKQHRIPYRESKMTRILSLGQNNGFTVMILNLAPVKAFHLDTLSSLNFANRTKKIEVREIENEPLFKGPPRPTTNSTASSDAQRQPLRPLTNNINVNMTLNRDGKFDKPTKLFSVYSDKSRIASMQATGQRLTLQKSSPLKRNADTSIVSSRPQKQARPAVSSTTVRRGPFNAPGNFSAAHIESLVERKVSQILAEKALSAPAPTASVDQPAVSADVQARLDSIERRLEGQEGERAEGLSYLFMAKQHQARGEEWSALKMYELAVPFFPENEKLQHKIDKLKRKLEERKQQEQTKDLADEAQTSDSGKGRHPKSLRKPLYDNDEHHHDYNPDESYAHNPSDSEGDAYSEHSFSANKTRRTTKKPKTKAKANLYHEEYDGPPTPRTCHLLSILNSRNPKQIQQLNGLGTKKAEMIAEHLNQWCQASSGANVEAQTNTEGSSLRTWNDVLSLDIRGIGIKSWQSMRDGLSLSG